MAIIFKHPVCLKWDTLNFLYAFVANLQITHFSDVHHKRAANSLQKQYGKKTYEGKDRPPVISQITAKMGENKGSKLFVTTVLDVKDDHEEVKASKQF